MSFLFSDYLINQFGNYQFIDNTPDDFGFVAVTGAELSTSYESNVETITGMAAGTAISIVDGEYRLDGGAYTTDAGTIAPGQTLQLRNASSDNNNETVSCSVTVGTLTRQWSITTASASAIIYTTSERLVVF